LMLAGAEVLLVPNATAWNPVRAHQLEARAFENMVAIASVNYPGDGWGQSSAYSPVVFDPSGRPLDPLLARANALPQLVPFRFDLDAIRDWRAREVWGAQYRRPDAYRRQGRG
ncbi:MAG: carbon-nitrogen hydrolase family protein, partial [Actinomycetes bacterium]